MGSISSFAMTSDANFGAVNNGAGTANSTLLSKESNVQQIDMTTAAGAQDAIAVIDSALSKVDGLRAMLGALQNRFSSSITNLTVNHENTSGANSRVLDADYSKEAAELAKLQVTQQ